MRRCNEETNRDIIPPGDRTPPVTIHMYEAGRKRAVAALDPVICGLSDTGNGLGLIHDALACDYLTGGA
jgi:hypothetical protein